MDLKSTDKVLVHACCAPCSGAILEWLVQHRPQPEEPAGDRAEAAGGAKGIDAAGDRAEAAGEGLPTVFFSNSNIFPLAEYELRRGELLRYAAQLGHMATDGSQVPTGHMATDGSQVPTGHMATDGGQEPTDHKATDGSQEPTDHKATDGSQEPKGLMVIDDVYDHEAWRCAVRGLEDEPERGQRCLQCFRFRLERAARYAHEHGFNVLTTTLASSRWKDLGQVDAAGSYACSLFPGLRWWGRNWRKGGLQERRAAIIREQQFYNQTWCGCEFSHNDKTNDSSCPLPVEAPLR